MNKMVMRGALVAALVAGTAMAGAAPASASASRYQNCAALNQQYKHGVAKTGGNDHVRGSTKPVTTFTVDDAAYSANRRLDRDKDGVACEKR